MSAEAYSNSAITCKNEGAEEPAREGNPKDDAVFSPYPGVFGECGDDASQQDVGVNSEGVLLVLAALLAAVGWIAWMLM